LGDKGINKGIIKTLEDESDRENFFYYNNGVTVICDSFDDKLDKTKTLVKNPQIVNGCQTVNSIYRVLKSVPLGEMCKFDQTFVMVKLLVVEKKGKHNNLYSNIVKYNNSQTAIRDKDFLSNKSFFRNLQLDFAEHGFCLLVKQSDKETYLNDKSYMNSLRGKASKLFSFIGVSQTT
jgi:hypothetical protein